jgi:hypothetical protein
MEKVFPIDGSIIKLAREGVPSARTRISPTGYGVIEKILTPGRYIVSIEPDVKITVNGSEMMKVGDNVQVSMSQVKPEKKIANANISEPLITSEKGFQWSAFIPLAFGGQGSLARIEAFFEKRKKGTREKETPAAFFIFTVSTEKLGEIQWSVYLRGRQLTLQVYTAVLSELKGGYRDMVREVEESLRQHGFVFAAPTVFLNKPFKIPHGFGLNVRG